jgi:hypothetical protein
LCKIRTAFVQCKSKSQQRPKGGDWPIIPSKATAHLIWSILSENCRYERRFRVVHWHGLCHRVLEIRITATVWIDSKHETETQARKVSQNCLHEVWLNRKTFLGLIGLI